MNIETPKYRASHSAGIFAGGIMHATGTEYESTEWPKPGATPVNDSAKRVYRYWSQGQAVSGFPRVLMHPEHGPYLPGILPRYVPHAVANRAPGLEVNDIRGFVPDDQRDTSLPEPPQYESTVVQRLGRHVVEAGSHFYFIGWPSLDSMEPVNGPAMAVTAYFARHKSHPQLLTGPWCHLRGTFLPRLETVPGSDKIPLDTEKYSAQIDAEVESITGKKRGERGSLPATTKAGSRTGIGHYMPAAFILKNRPKEA